MTEFSPYIPALAAMKAPVRDRMIFIFDFLSTAGYINSLHLCRRFGLSRPVAIQQLKLYRQVVEKLVFSGRHGVYHRANSQFSINLAGLMSDTFGTDATLEYDEGEQS